MDRRHPAGRAQIIQTLGNLQAAGGFAKFDIFGSKIIIPAPYQVRGTRNPEDNGFPTFRCGSPQRVAPTSAGKACLADFYNSLNLV
jgi:hypothetical protein